MIFRTKFLFAAIAAALFMPVTPLRAGDLDSTLARMDKAALGFTGLTADIKSVSHTFIIKDTTEETGRMTLQRPKPRQMQMLVEFTTPAPRAVAFAGRKVQMYYPKMNTVQEYDLGKQAALIDQFLLLGFGGSGKDLSRSYQVKAMGQEKVNGVSATRLVLTPKTAKVRESIKSVEIWVPDGEAYPIRQKFVEPSDDFTEVTYRGIKVNPGLTPAHLKLELPAGVKREYPQK